MPRSSKSRSKPNRRRSRPTYPAHRSRTFNWHRQVRKGKTYLITKHCSDERFFIRPSPEVNQILCYLLILKAVRYGIQVHAFCFMSNHFHLVVTDTRGKLPAFMREFLSESSKAIQRATQDDRTIWHKRRYADCKMLDLDAAERKLVYTLLNPSRAGLTDPEDWPGLTSAGLAPGDVVECARPGIYFSKRRPELVSFELVPVSLPFQEPCEASEQRVSDLLRTGLAECYRILERHFRSMLGREAVLAFSRDHRGRRLVGGLNPRFATRNRELLKQAIRDAYRFEVDHEVAKRSYSQGSRAVVFPAGTYGYRVLLGVRVKRQGDVA